MLPEANLQRAPAVEVAEYLGRLPVDHLHSVGGLQRGCDGRHPLDSLCMGHARGREEASILEGRGQHCDPVVGIQVQPDDELRRGPQHPVGNGVPRSHSSASSAVGGLRTTRI